MPYLPKKNCLDNRIILITGAGSGLGEVIAKAYASYGAQVILLGRTVAKLERVYDAIVAAGHPMPAIYPLDLSGANEADYTTLAVSLKREFGHLDGLLHNAAILGETTPLMQTEMTYWRRVFQVNLHAPLMLTQACMPLLKASSQASVVFTEHRCAGAFWNAYGISKAAVAELAKQLALECNGKPQINCVAPEGLASPMRQRSYPGEDPSQHAKMESAVTTYIRLMDTGLAPLNGVCLSVVGAGLDL